MKVSASVYFVTVMLKNLFWFLRIKNICCVCISIQQHNLLVILGVFLNLPNVLLVSMEPTSVAFAMPKENGGSQAADTVEGDILGYPLAKDGPEILTSDLHKPALHYPEGEGMEELLENEEMPDLDDFAHPLANDEVVVETVVVTSLNGSQKLNEPSAQDALCKDDGIVSNENEDSTPNLEFSGDINRISDDVEVSEAAEDVDKVEATVEAEQSIKTSGVAKEVQPEENQQKESKQQTETDTDKGKMTGKKNRERNRSTSEESTGKEAVKGKFAIQADLNINSRPKRSTPRRSVFELLQGEIKSTGTSKRSSTDTGSESDPEPGPSKRSVTKKSRLAGSEQLEAIDEVDRNKGEKPQGNRKGKGIQVKGKSQGKEEKRPNREIRKKSADASHVTETLTAEHGDIFMADDFDVVETVVGADANEAEAIEDEDDVEFTLEKFRAANPIQCVEDDPVDGQNVPCEDPTVEIGADAECELEYNSRWHSYATPRQLESPPPVRKADSVEPPDLKNETHQPDSEEHNELADDEIAMAAETASKKRTKYDRAEAPELEAIVDRDKGQSSTPWYVTTTSDDGFLGDTKALKSRIDELIAVNAELKARLKEVENKTATKKFNIDFHSRKFSRAREPVFGSPADRKLVIERKSVGKAAVGSPAEKGTVGISVEKDLKQKELMLARREEKLRALDVELDERMSQLKVNEGKLWRTERRLKEMEKTLDYRERVLRRMEMNTEKKDVETKDATSTDATGTDATSTDATITAVDTEPTGPDAPGKEVDDAKLKRKEQELERQRKFLNEEREKLLPKQQRLTKWEAELRKKEDELRSRDQELRTAIRSKKEHSSRSDDESESEEDEVVKQMKKPVRKSQAAVVHKKPPNSLGKSKKVPPAKVIKVTIHCFFNCCEKIYETPKWAHQLSLHPASDNC